MSIACQAHLWIQVLGSQCARTGGWGKHISFSSFCPQKNSPAATKKRPRQQAGKKERGLGEGIFARLLPAEGGIRVGAASPVRQHRSNARKMIP